MRIRKFACHVHDKWYSADVCHMNLLLFNELESHRNSDPGFWFGAKVGLLEALGLGSLSMGRCLLVFENLGRQLLPKAALKEPQMQDSCRIFGWILKKLLSRMHKIF